MKKWITTLAAVFCFIGLFAQAPKSSLKATYNNNPVLSAEEGKSISAFTLTYESESELEVLRQKAKRFESSGVMLQMNGEEEGTKTCFLSFTDPSGIKYLHKMFLVFEINTVVQAGKEMTLAEFLAENQ